MGWFKRRVQDLSRCTRALLLSALPSLVYSPTHPLQMLIQQFASKPEWTYRHKL
jgi:hypothetical protein